MSTITRERSKEEILAVLQNITKRCDALVTITFADLHSQLQQLYCDIDDNLIDKTSD